MEPTLISPALPTYFQQCVCSKQTLCSRVQMRMKKLLSVLKGFFHALACSGPTQKIGACWKVLFQLSLRTFGHFSERYTSNICALWGSVDLGSYMQFWHTHDAVNRGSLYCSWRTPSDVAWKQCSCFSSYSLVLLVTPPINSVRCLKRLWQVCKIMYWLLSNQQSVSQPNGEAWYVANWKAIHCPWTCACLRCLMSDDICWYVLIPGQEKLEWRPSQCTSLRFLFHRPKATQLPGSYPLWLPCWGHVLSSYLAMAPFTSLEAMDTDTALKIWNMMKGYEKMKRYNTKS